MGDILLKKTLIKRLLLTNDPLLAEFSTWKRPRWAPVLATSMGWALVHRSCRLAWGRISRGLKADFVAISSVTWGTNGRHNHWLNKVPEALIKYHCWFFSHSDILHKIPFIDAPKVYPYFLLAQLFSHGKLPEAYHQGEWHEHAMAQIKIHKC